MLKVQELREIIRLVDQSSISEFCYEKDDSKIKIKKQVAVVAEQPASQKVVETPVVEEKKETVTVKEVPKKQAKTEDVEDSDDKIIEIITQMVATFYRKPTPEANAYVNEGSKVTDNTIVCIVEAMKLFNEIEAEVQGEIVDILVGDGELVEYGQPLFKVKTK